MKLRDLTELAARNLREAMLRNSLTTLGIAVGVASLVAMLSLGVGLQELASTRLSKTGLFDAIFVMSRANQRAFGGRPQPASDSNEPVRRLDDDARQQLAQLKNVVEVYPEVRFPTDIQFDGKTYPTVVAGIPASARADGSFDGMQGTFFSAPDADEAILQIELAKDLSKTPDALIGKEITLRYAERQSLPEQPPPPPALGGKSAAEASAGSDAAGFSPGFSVIARELKLRIIGIVETEPAAGFGGLGRGRLLIPQQIAQKLRIA
ncbi:MAG: ABC transporter permease, partial [Candidatus Acidiferrales bacterium]